MKAKNETEKFFELLPKLSPENFVGVLTIFSIPLMGKDGAPRSFEDVYLDLATKWRDLTPRRRHNLIKLMTAAAKEEKSRRSTAREE